MTTLPGWHRATVVGPVTNPIDERKHPTDDLKDPRSVCDLAVVCVCVMVHCIGLVLACL